jgi:mevalonate kinase
VIRSRMYGAVAALAVALATPGILAAQQAPPATPDQQELEAIFAEFQQIHLQLEDIQMQALSDPQLNAAQEELGQEIRAAMEDRDPAIRQRIERMEALEGEAVSAQEAGDVDKLQALMTEAQTIEEQFLTVQQQVLEAPPIAAKIDAFQAQLERKMIEVDPGTATLIARFRELETRLEAALGGGA